MNPPTEQLRDVARAALNQQGIAVGQLQWMGQHTNHLFRCDTASGERLVVRVCLPGGRSDAELDAELTWLAALTRDTGLTVPVAQFSTAATGRCVPCPRDTKGTRPRCWPPAAFTSPSGTWPTENDGHPSQQPDRTARARRGPPLAGAVS